MLKKQLEDQDRMVNEKTSSIDKAEGEEPIDIKNKFMTYFLLFFPTVILIAIPGVINNSVTLGISLKILIAFYQFVTVKTFVDKYYE